MADQSSNQFGQHGELLGSRSSEPPPQVPDHEVHPRPIGGGSYGRVYLARNVMGTWRAVKVVYRSRFDSDRTYERDFEGVRRFEPVSHLHPSQLTILHVGRNDAAGYFYYVMELADDANSLEAQSIQRIDAQSSPSAQGAILLPRRFPLSSHLDPDTYIPLTLRQKLEQHCRLPFRECLDTSLALALALSRLHKHDLVHRDIKPSNIVFVNGLPKLADIGLVTAAGARTFVGTEGYLPPEGPGTVAADLFSLGRVMYEMMTGLDRAEFPQLPPGFQDFEDHDQFVELNKVVLRAAADDPGSRYHSAEQLHEDLVAVQARKHVLDLQALARRSKGLRIAAWGLGAAAAVLGILALIQSQAARTERRATLIQEAARLRLVERHGEWRSQSLDLLRQAGEMGLNDEIRGQAVATLAGTQGHTRRSFRHTAATHLAFDATGQRLILDGGGENRPARQPLSAQDFADLPAFARKLQRPADPVSAHLAGRLSPATRRDLAKYRGAGPLPIALQSLVLDDLKRIANEETIYDRQRFAGVTLRQETEALLGQSLRAAELMILNRMLLEDAYPFEIARMRRGCVWDKETDQCREFATTNIGPVWFSADGRPRQFAHVGGRLLAVLDLEDNRLIQRFALGREVTRVEPSPSEGRVPRGPDWEPASTQAKDSRLASPKPASMRTDRVTVDTGEGGSSSLRSDSPPPGQVLLGAESATNPSAVVLAVSADGSLCAASAAIGSSAELALWDTDSGRCLARTNQHCCALAFSPAGDCLATGGSGGEVKVWSVPGLDLVSTFPAGRLRIHCLAFGRDPARAGAPWSEHPWLLAAGDAGGMVNLYEVVTGRLRRTFAGSQFAVYSLAFGSDGMTLVSGGYSVLRLWDIATGRIKTTIGFDRAVALAFAPDGKTLAAGMKSIEGGHGISQLIDVDKGWQVGTLGGLSAPCAKVAFSPDERWLAGLSHNWEVAVWDMANHRLDRVLAVPPGNSADNAALAFSPDAGELAFATRGSASVWDRRTGQCVNLWTNLPPGLAQQLAYDRAGHLLHFQWDRPESPNTNGICRIRDLLSADPTNHLAQFAECRSVLCAALSLDGQWAVVCAAGQRAAEDAHRLQVFEPLTGRLRWELPSENRGSSDWFAMDPGGTVLAYQHPVRLDVTLYRIPEGTPWEKSLAFVTALSPAGNWQTTARLDNGPGLELHRADDAHWRLVLGVDNRTQSQAFSPSGHYLAWGTDQGTVYFCDLQRTISELETQKLGWRGKH